MADNLEDIIRGLAARGELSHISLAGPTNSPGSKEARRPAKFRASFSMCSKFGVSFAEHEDPVEAIRIACTTAKMKPQKQPSFRPTVIDETPVADLPADLPADEGVDDLM